MSRPSSRHSDRMASECDDAMMMLLDKMPSWQMLNLQRCLYNCYTRFLRILTECVDFRLVRKRTPPVMPSDRLRHQWRLRCVKCVDA